MVEPGDKDDEEAGVGEKVKVAGECGLSLAAG
jgi:hypothetical protein